MLNLNYQPSIAPAAAASAATEPIAAGLGNPIAVSEFLLFPAVGDSPLNSNLPKLLLTDTG